MKPKLDQSKYSPLILTGLIVLLLGTLPICFCQNNQHNQACRQPFWCGNIKEIGYPFWGGDRPESCGYPGFQLSCRNNTFRLNISSISYRLLDIDSTTQTLKVSRDDLSNTLCPRILLNTTLNSTLFDFSSTANDKNITLYYGCNPSGRPAANQFSCNVNGSNSWGFYFAMETSENNVSLTCSSSIYVPVSQNVARALAGPTIPPKTKLLQDALANGFSIQWSVNNDCHNCVQSGGLCEHNNNNHGPGSFLCYCSDGPHNFTCNDTGYKKRLSHLQKYVIIGVSLGLAVIVLSSLTIFYIAKEYRLRKQDQESNQDIDKVLLNHGSLAPKRYKYNEIKKITKSFTDKLGKGGYGIIYKGKLPDGQLVAVKVLTETDDNAQDFINEVSSISQTSHVNIVNLLGFCYERKKRALVYEFMPNKSLDNYISKNRSLEWEKLYEIAVGIARGLEYLHRGCNTRIVHFDIKPQNILLDEDLCPKISDFGLAKLFKKKQSIISMLGMRGTIGYIAPEVFSRNFGVVSHKSDVYSYGMMLLEMAGAKKAVGMEGNQSSEDFFPDKIYERVLLENEKLDDFMVEEKEENARKMLLVGVWCIQTNPSDRPSMSKVVEMLEGSVGSIQIPPKPFVSSPVLSPQTSSSYSATLEIENSIKG